MGSVYRNDFVELFNQSAAAVNLSGWSIQYASASGTTWDRTLLNGTIQPGHYFLVVEHEGTNLSLPLLAPDVIGSLNLSATDGKVALVSSTSVLTGSDPGVLEVADLVGYGSANRAIVNVLDNVTAAIRSSGGCSDSFTVAAPNPRNSETTRNACVPGLNFVPVTPCRVADTRNPQGQFGGPSLAGSTSRSFSIPTSVCGTPPSAQAYSLNVTAVPQGPLSYLTIWPTGQSQPFVSTLNSFDGRIKANAAIVPAGTNGAVNVYVTNTADVILDINGYFVSAANAPINALQFYPLSPCRISDTRNANGSLGGPSLVAGVGRTVPVLTACGVPFGAQAYSLNFTSVPNGPLGYVSTWPAGQNQPLVSTLNAPTGAITANAAIVPAGSGGSINVYASNNSDLIIDINGYFAAPSANGLSFYSLVPCRISDTRNPIGTFGGPIMAPGQTRTWPLAASPCGIPTGAKAYALNATVVPPASLQYLTLWPAGGVQPFVSTLNSFDASIVANAALVPAGFDGSVSAFATNLTELILDVSGYFAP